MGGNSRVNKKSSSSAPTTSLSLFSFFKSSRRSSHFRDDLRIAEDAKSPRKVWPSEDDKRGYVAKPGIDRIATTVIAKRHENWISESKHEAIKFDE
ncbi:hypothetical protein CDL15_Pgr018264 [Punica granatum]|uniref:Uncharacterized protein n=2 Tax=Punica granatum TaxID=22663 RepID=A0A218WIS7_PUNGR|nr:hypothetical protein CDL15_Pgr018264 [Punica granatum]